LIVKAPPAEHTVVQQVLTALKENETSAATSGRR
jgi:hypothetical protein